MSISLNISLVTSLANETPINLSPGSQAITKNGIGKYSLTASVGTSEKSLTSFGELTTQGICVLRNTDTANFVKWGFSTGVYGGKIKAGETYCFRMEPSADLYLIADTATCLVDVDILED